jgi:hypothetical protein
MHMPLYLAWYRFHMSGTSGFSCTISYLLRSLLATLTWTVACCRWIGFRPLKMYSPSCPRVASGWHIDETQCGAVENCLLTSWLVSGLSIFELGIRIEIQNSNIWPSWKFEFTLGNPRQGTTRYLRLDRARRLVVHPQISANQTRERGRKA